MTQSAQTYPINPGEPDLPSLYETDGNASRRWWLWSLILALAILLHLTVFMAHIEWAGPTPPPRVEVQQIDPKKLDEIRRRWNESDKQLLLNNDKSKPNESTPPKDARYMSDRNIRVEKEQRARDHVITPRPGHPAIPQEQNKASTQQNQRSETRTRTLPKLGNLGVPFRLGEMPHEKQEGAQTPPNPPPQAAQPGGQQYIADKNLPMGSENILNSEESVYYAFYARLYDAIGPLWSSKLRESSPGSRVMPGDYTTAVDVVLDREGNLVEVRLLQSSGVREFDNAVDVSWKRIGRFPNPPSGLFQPDGHVHTGWNFTVQVGGAGMGGLQLMPPERSY